MPFGIIPDLVFGFAGIPNEPRIEQNRTDNDR